MIANDWLTTAVINLARGIREDDAPERLPILADAIEDAGGPQEWIDRARGTPIVKCRSCQGTGRDNVPYGERCDACGGEGETAAVPPLPAVVSMVLASSPYQIAYQWDEAEGIVVETPQRLTESLRAISEAREWDAPRLLYADLIEPTDPQRSEFVRVGCEWTRIFAHRPGHNGGTSTGMRDPMKEWRDEFNDLRRRERELWPHVYSKIVTHEVHQPIFGGGATEVGPCFERNLRAGIVIARGFVRDITCTWADWLRIADGVYWHPEQREACSWCHGVRRVATSKGYSRPRGNSPWEVEYVPGTTGDCTRCHGTGTVPRPFPVTAQPLEVVRLTTLPEAGEWVGERFSLEFAHQRWPGLRFEFTGGS